MCFIVQVILEGIRGRTYQGDIAVDDITFTKSGCGGKRLLLDQLWSEWIGNTQCMNNGQHFECTCMFCWLTVIPTKANPKNAITTTAGPATTTPPPFGM
jgi:hypothetical protein